ncbi:hypothetical protein ISR92_01180 [Patescibacteria group bacterium]|nr:hypothetical protein [Patescibacteria group bacterium]
MSKNNSKNIKESLNMEKYKCINCGKESSLEDPDTNWVILHKRNKRRLLGCDCGYGLYPGKVSSMSESPEIVSDQKEQLKKAGIDLGDKA